MFTHPPSGLVCPNAAAIAQECGYDLLGRIGQGAHATVYLARRPDEPHCGQPHTGQPHTGQPQTVALKIAGGDLSRHADSGFARERLRQEARCLEIARHPAVPRLYHFTEFGDCGCLVLQYVPGCTLREALALEPWSLAESLRLICALLSCLGTLHRNGVYHCDLKPDNILLSPEPGGAAGIKLIDFSAAWRRDREWPVTPEAPGQLFGTPAYMSPEQASGTRVDHRADLFAVGTLLHEMLTGRRPFGAASGKTPDSDDSNVLATLHAVCYSEPVLDPTLPDGVIKALVRALQKQPQDRFQSAAAFADALRAASFLPAADVSFLSRLRTRKRSLFRAKSA